MENKKKNKWWIGVTLIIVLILLCSGLIYWRMPKRYCHNEERIEKVELQAYCPEIEDYYFSIREDFEIIPKNAKEILCEDGAYVSPLWNWLETYSCEPKICLIKIVKEVCEIV